MQTETEIEIRTTPLESHFAIQTNRKRNNNQQEAKQDPTCGQAGGHTPPFYATKADFRQA